MPSCWQVTRHHTSQECLALGLAHNRHPVNYYHILIQACALQNEDSKWSCLPFLPHMPPAAFSAQGLG